MKKYIVLITMIISMPVFAGEKFEINKKNCNLPMQKIRQLVPDKAKQKAIYRQCVKQANKEKWTLRSVAGN